MNKILKYLHSLCNYHYNTLFTPKMVSEIDQKVNDYILYTFNKIPKKKYFYLELAEDGCKCEIYVDDDLYEALIKDYPEEMI